MNKNKEQGIPEITFKEIKNALAEDQIPTCLESNPIEEMPLPLGEVVNQTADGYEVVVDLDEVQKVVESEEFSQYLIDHATTMGTIAFITQKVLEAVAEEKQNEIIERMMKQKEEKEEKENGGE